MNKPYLIQGKKVIQGPAIGSTYTGIYPIQVDNLADTISIILDEIASRQSVVDLTDTVRQKVNVTQWTEKYTQQDIKIVENEDMGLANLTKINTNIASIKTINDTLNVEIPKVDALDISQAQQDISIANNRTMIDNLILENKSQVNFLGAYDSTKTYKKNDGVTHLQFYYISLIDNNTSPLTSTTAWFKTSPTVAIDLTEYAKTSWVIETLEPLEQRLVSEETKLATAQGDIGTLKTDKANITSNDFSGIQTLLATATSSNYIQFKRDGVSIGYMGKRRATSDDISLVANQGDLILSGNTIRASTKRIVEVADGVDNNDAVNVGQLNAGLALKEDITSVDAKLALKSDITYVDGLTNGWVGDLGLTNETPKHIGSLGGKKIYAYYLTEKTFTSSVGGRDNELPNIRNCIQFLNVFVERKTIEGTWESSSSSWVPINIRLFPRPWANNTVILKLRDYAGEGITLDNKIRMYMIYISSENV